MEDPEYGVERVTSVEADLKDNILSGSSTHKTANKDKFAADRPQRMKQGKHYFVECLLYYYNHVLCLSFGGR